MYYALVQYTIFICSVTQECLVLLGVSDCEELVGVTYRR
ncbi:uncharacterized protein METZ01_LOCUS247425 [marine metagenome]|uniref:Uncharacterized protein n=1 Tax=marine metagenome TaxID=408172 RepID=A0A382I7A6_9ZZZZ